jgi:hypothetical protein
MQFWFGKVGDPSRQNPMELQRVWQITEDIRARHGNQQIGIDEGAYGPLTDCQAVRYRAMILWAMRYFSQNADQLRKEVKEPKDLEEVNTLERWLNTPVPTGGHQGHVSSAVNLAPSGPRNTRL